MAAMVSNDVFLAEGMFTPSQPRISVELLCLVLYGVYAASKRQ